MSATTDKEVALAYATGGEGANAGGILFCMDQGLVDRGADLAWLSQYPHESEVLFAPLAGLGVVSTRVDGSVLVVQMRLNVNHINQTVEQVVGRRKTLLADMAHGLKLELLDELPKEWSHSMQHAAADRFYQLMAEGPLEREADTFNRDDAIFVSTAGTMIFFKNEVREGFLKLKSDVINAFRAGEAKAGNVATIEVAIEALKLAEFATRSLMRQL